MNRILLFWLLAIGVVATPNVLGQSRKRATPVSQTVSGSGAVSVPEAFDKRINKAINVLASSTPMSSTVGNSLFIFSHTESANPGGFISLQGNFPSTVTPCLLVGSGERYITLSVVSQMSNNLQCRLPANLTMGLYQVFVQLGTARSATKFINRAKGYGFDSPESYPGGPLSITGRDLVLPGVSPVITFVSQTTSTSLVAPLIRNTSHRFKLTVRVPRAVVAGQNYDVFVTNGYGGAVGTTKIPTTLATIGAVSDTLRLGIGWSARFPKSMTTNLYNVVSDARLTLKMVGDGVTNNYAALQSIVNKISSDGGGVAFVPNGDYSLTTSDGTAMGITIPSNVIIRGNRRDSVVFNYRGTNQTFFYVAPGASSVGIEAITFNHVGTTKTRQLQVEGQNVFVQNTRWSSGSLSNNMFYFESSSNVLIARNEIRETGVSDLNPLTVVNIRNGTYATLRENLIGFTGTAIQILKQPKSFVENNTLIRDTRPQILSSNVTHQIATASCPQSIYAGNVLDIVNGPTRREALPAGTRDPNGFTTIPRENDGESLIVENIEPWLTSAFVTASTTTSITDNTRSWTGQFKGVKPYITIVKGVGTGQVRQVVSRTASTITVSPAWEVPPGVGSRYVVFNSDVDETIFFRNRFTGQQRGFTFYAANVTGADVVENELINSGSIDFMGHHMNYQNDPALPRLSIMRGINIEKNVVDCSTDPFNGCSYNVSPTQHLVFEHWGTLAMVPRLADNILKVSVPVKKSIVDDDYPGAFNLNIIFHRHTSQTNNYFIAYPDGEAQSVLGSILENNTCIDCPYAVTLGPHTVGTVIAGMKLIAPGNPPLTVESYIESAPGVPGVIGSFNTVIVKDK